MKPTRVRQRGEQVRRYILDNVTAHPNDIASVTAERFGISRQAVNKHLQHLIREGSIKSDGRTRSQTYELRPVAEELRVFNLTPGLEEDVVWRNDIVPFLGELPVNVLDIWHYGFTEMFNNAIDHSNAKTIVVGMKKTAQTAEITVQDNGVGIFNKIKDALGLLDVSHAVLELAKGKLTTDPKRHTGEGIFFSSRMFDEFVILSSGTFFSHKFGAEEDWVLESKVNGGTLVGMVLHNHTARTTKSVFREYSTDGDFGFTKTVVPVALAQYGDDKLISRSQAKRLLARVDRFKTVLMDFKDVSSIGQAFADEIFRVFREQHPEIDLYPINANADVQDMILRAENVGSRGHEGPTS